MHGIICFNFLILVFVALFAFFIFIHHFLLRLLSGDSRSLLVTLHRAFRLEVLPKLAHIGELIVIKACTLIRIHTFVRVGFVLVVAIVSLFALGLNSPGYMAQIIEVFLMRKVQFLQVVEFEKVDDLIELIDILRSTLG